MTPTLVLRNAVAAAVMAPSTHNTQPWKFRIRGTSLHLLADVNRHLRIMDPTYRQLVHSCGCALFNARVAIHAMGFEAHVKSELVGEDVPEHVASILLGDRRTPTDSDRLMMTAIGHRTTNRHPFLPRPVPPADVDAFVALAAAEAVTVARLDPDRKTALAELIDEADNRQLDDRAYREELFHWLVPATSRRRDGIPFAEKEYGSEKLFALSLALNSKTLGAAFGMLEHSIVRSSPAVIVLGTDRDEPDAWLRCGQALEAILLHATTRGLAASFLNQLLEIPALREEVARLAPAVGHPQMILRVGVPSEPTSRLSARRRVSEVLVP